MKVNGRRSKLAESIDNEGQKESGFLKGKGKKKNNLTHQFTHHQFRSLEPLSLSLISLFFSLQLSEPYLCPCLHTPFVREHTVRYAHRFKADPENQSRMSRQERLISLLSTLMIIILIIINVPHLNCLIASSTILTTAGHHSDNDSSSGIERMEQSSSFPSQLSSSSSSFRSTKVKTQDPGHLVTHDVTYGPVSAAYKMHTMGSHNTRSSRQMMAGGIFPAIGAVIAIGKIIGLKAGIIKTIAAGAAGASGVKSTPPTIITNVLPPGAAAGGFRRPFLPLDPDVTNIRYQRIPGASQSIQKVSVDDTTGVGNDTLQVLAQAVDPTGIETESQPDPKINTSGLPN